MSALHEATGLFKHHVGHLDMPFRRFVKGGCNHLGLYATAHVGNLFGTFVDKEDYLVNLRVIVGYGVGYSLEQHCLTGFGLSHDKAPLALSDGREHIHYPAGEILLMAMAQKVEFLSGEQGSEEIERNPVPHELGSPAVYVIDLYQGEILVSFFGRTDLTGNGIAVLQGVELDLVLGDVNVVRGIQVVVIR